MNSQIEAQAVDGSFEEFVPWGDGYLGVVYTNGGVFIPKHRNFQYFDAGGSRIWNVEADPFNFQNNSICNNESDYAYLVNLPFRKEALAEKSSKKELLNVHQFHKSGKVMEKAIAYTGPLAPMAELAKKIRPLYLAALKNGLIFISTTDDKTYHIVKIDTLLNVSYKSMDFEWDEKLWEKNMISEVKYVLNGDELSLIQIKREGAELTNIIRTINTNDISDVREVINRVNFTGFNLSENNAENIQNSLKEETFITYQRYKTSGSSTYIYPTLGSFVNYEYTKNGLKMYMYFRNMKEDSKKEVEKEGFLSFDLDNNEDLDEIENSVFEFSGGEDGTKGDIFHITPEGEFVFITQVSKNEINIKSSDGSDLKFDGELNFQQAFLSYISGENQLNELDHIICADGKYAGIDLDPYTKSAKIYKY